MKSAEMQAEKAAIFSEIERMNQLSEIIAKMQDHLLNDSMDEPELKLKQVNGLIDSMTEAVTELFEIARRD